MLVDVGGWLKSIARIGVGVLVAAAACQRIDIEQHREVALADAQGMFGHFYCKQMFECACAQGHFFDDEDACRRYVGDEIAELRDAPPIIDVVYDPWCVGAIVDELDELGCGVETDADGGCRSPCPAYHGEQLDGQPCIATDDARYSNCTRGLTCVVDACDYHAASDAYLCTGECVDPCERQVQPGSSCTNGCATDERCDEQTGTCQELVEIGEPCSGHSQCASGYCPAGACADQPARGESCAQTFACAAGLTCDTNSYTCVDSDPRVCQWIIDIG